MAWQDFNTIADAGNPGMFMRPQPEQKKPKKNFLVDQISTAGGILGGIGGSFIAPIAGTAGGSALGSALGQALENAIAGDSIGKDVGKEALLGGIFGAGPIKLAKAGLGAARGARAAAPVTSSAIRTVEGEVLPNATRGVAKTSLQGKLSDLGNKLLTSQYGTIGKPVARATKPEETFGTLANYGLTKPEDVERVAGLFTGSNGIVNNAVLKAVGKSGRIPTTGIQQIFDDAVELNGLVDKDAQAVRSVFRAQMKKLMGGPGGSLDPNASPNDVLDVMKALEKRAANLTGKGSNYRLSTPERVDQAKALLSVRDELQDRLYSAAGAKGGLNSVLTPEFRQSLVNLQPGNEQWQKFVDETVLKSKDIGALRSTMAPFVRARQVIDEADINSTTFGGRTGNLANSLAGGTLGTILGPVGGIASSAVQAAASNPVARAASTALRRAGSAELRTAPQVVRPSAAAIGTRLGLVGALTGTANQVGQAAVSSSVPDMPLDTTSSGMPLQQTQTVSDSPFDAANIEDSVRQIFANGGTMKDASDFVSLASALQGIRTSGSGELGSTAAGQVAASANATNTLDQLQGLFGTAGGGSGKIAGSLKNALSRAGLEGNTQTYNDLAASSVSQLARALNGTGQVSDADAAVVIQALPKITDSPAVAERKFAALRARLNAARQNTLLYNGVPGDTTTR